MRLVIFRLLGAILLAALALLAMALPDAGRQITGISLSAVSFLLLLLGLKHLGASFAIKLQARELVTRGLFAKIQHPLFFFVDMMLLGIVIWADLSWLLLVWGLLIVLHILQARREEKFLQAAFGEKFTAYQSRTWF